MLTPKLFKENWPQLAMLVVTNIISVFVSMQIAVAKMDTRVAAVEHKLDDLDHLNLPEVVWQEKRDAEALSVQQVRNEKEQADVSQINNRLAGIDVKLDSLVAASKK